MWKEGKATMAVATNSARIIKITTDSTQAKAALDVERRLLNHYGLQGKSQYVSLKQTPIRVRVLEVGTGRPVLVMPGGIAEQTERVFANLSAVLAGLNGIWKRLGELASLDARFTPFLDRRDAVRSELEELVVTNAAGAHKLPLGHVSWLSCFCWSDESPLA